MVDGLIVVGMLVLITTVHELAHALVAVGLGFKLKKLFLGIPLDVNIKGRKFSTKLWSLQKNGVEYGISWLILGGAVDFHDLENAPWWKLSLIAIVGPISNLLMAFVVLVVFVGWDNAVMVTQTLSWAVLEGLRLVGTLDPKAVSQVTGPAGFVVAMSKVANEWPMGWLLVWSVLNVALFVTNMLPIPALDGGQVSMSILGAILGKKYEPIIRKVTIGTLYFLCAVMVVVLAKDLANGIGWLLTLFR